MGLVIDWPAASDGHAAGRTNSRCGVADEARTHRTVASFKVGRRLSITAADAVRRLLDRVAPDAAAADGPRQR